jgi:hypothetical protein
MTVVNSMVAGILGALIAAAADASVWLIATVGTLSGSTYLIVAVAIAGRKFSAGAIHSRFPSP